MEIEKVLSEEEITELENLDTDVQEENIIDDSKRIESHEVE